MSKMGGEDKRKEEESYDKYYPPNWPDNPFHHGEVMLQQRAGAQEHIMTYANEKFKPYMPDSHRSFFEGLPFLAVAAVDPDGYLWSTLLFAPEPNVKPTGFCASPDPVTLEIDMGIVPGDALCDAFQVGSDLSILGMDWGQCTRNKVNGRITSRDGGKITFKVDQSIPHCPKYINPKEWRVVKDDELKIGKKYIPIERTSLSSDQEHLVDSAEAIFVATVYRGEGEDPRFGNDVNYRGGPAGFIRREGSNKLFIPDFPGNHHFNTQGNLILDSRIGLAIPRAHGGMLQLSGTASVKDIDPLQDSSAAEAVIEITVQKVLELPPGSLPIEWVPIESATMPAGRTETAAESKEFIDLVHDAVARLRPYRAPLTDSDKALVMHGWSKVLRYRSSFAEALWIRWRFVVLLASLKAAGQDNDDSVSNNKSTANSPVRIISRNADPIAMCLGDRATVIEESLLFCIDTAFRSLCPDTQNVICEGYRPYQDEEYITEKKGSAVRLDCRSLDDHLKSFARLGILPDFWVSFVEAFEWAMKTHMPCAEGDDIKDINLGPNSAFLRAIVKKLVIPAIQACKRLKLLATKEPYRSHLKSAMSVIAATKESLNTFGENFYLKLLSDHPLLLDYFASTNIDALAPHFAEAQTLIANSANSLGDGQSQSRKVWNHLAEIHRQFQIPTFSYLIVGEILLDVLRDCIEAYSKQTDGKVTVEELRDGFHHLYLEVMAIVYYPMLRQETLIADATSFYTQLQHELGWTKQQLENRLFQVEGEIHATGTYRQTTDEITAGARIAWRNSAKCIGRETWKSLIVHDCRHLKEPEGIFEAMQEQLRVATSGSTIQPIMTFFSAQEPDELLGDRFWSPELLQYAGYVDEETGETLGDQSNARMTKFLTDKKNWGKSSAQRSEFDLLPVVFKLERFTDPSIFELPKELVPEVDIEHPTKPEISDLGLKWFGCLTVTNLRLNIGGIIYPNVPFTRPYLSSEIARCLEERYDALTAVAKKLDLDISTYPTYRQIASSELEIAILYSFKKKGIYILDSYTAGESFCAHVRKERKDGRECPAQWSRIGALSGPTGPAWKMEMRDFLVKPHFDYSANGLVIHTNALEQQSTAEGIVETSDGAAKSNDSLPRVLILVGSATGKSEAVARRLKRSLRLLKPTVMTLGEAAGLADVGEVTHIFCVCSTFGKGNPPENARKFFETPISTNAKIKYSILALGSSVYPDFCKAGKDLDKLLAAAGFEQLFKVVTVDEATGSRTEMECWLNFAKNSVLPPGLESALELEHANSSADPPYHKFSWGDVVPTMGEAEQGSLCIENEELVTEAKNKKSIRKVSFEIPDDWSYETGDHLSVQPVNSEELVVRFLKCFEYEILSSNPPPEITHDDAKLLDWQWRRDVILEYVENGETSEADTFFKCPTSLQTLATEELDLALSEKNVIDLLQAMKGSIDVAMEKSREWREALTSDALLTNFLALCDPVLEFTPQSDGQFVMDDIIANYPTVPDLFEAFKSIFFLPRYGNPILTLPEILVFMTRLQPRLYSISSCCRVDPKKITITVGVLITKTSKGAIIKGVCSNYLASLKPGVDRAMISVTTSGFRLPSSPKNPMIMVGTGTGLAPLYAFIQDRKLDHPSRKETNGFGEYHLFFGCRTDGDFIYKDDIMTCNDDGMLNTHLALSRSKSCPKTYVQDLISQNGEKIADLLMQDDTHYYVCGDARMADACFEACVDALRKHMKMSRVNAVMHLRGKVSKGQWQVDVWGIVSHFESAKKQLELEKRAAAKIWMTRQGF